jgi:hypothetical protein
MPPFVVCPVCHLRNEVTARFCRSCGLPLGAPRDPVRGTTTRRADLPSERGAGIAAVISLVAIVAIAGIAGFLVFRGFDSAPTTAGAGATASPSLVVPASGGPTATAEPTQAPTEAPGAVATDDPGAEPTPDAGDPTDDPGDEATPDPDEPSAEPTAKPLSTRTSFTCDDAAIQDPLGGRWRVTGIRSGQRDGYDRLTFDLARLQGSTRTGAIVGMEFLRPARAASRYDVTMPDGDRALVITFDGPIALRSDIATRPGLTALASVAARTDGDGVVHAVLGITGDGCARLVANDWRNGGDDTTTAKLIVDIQR